MATRITSLDHPYAITGANNKHVAEAPNGRLWVLVYSDTANKAKFFWSENQGATWHYSSDSDIQINQNYTVTSFYIDAEGYGHVAWAHWDASSQHVHYHRGKPSSSGRTFYWSVTRIYPAAGRIGRDADIVAFRRGTSWDVWIYWELHSAGHRLSKLTVSANGTVTINQASIDPGNSTGNLPFGGLEFNHNGDGITPDASPHLYVYGGHRQTSDVRAWRGAYASGAWTFDKTVALEAVTVDQTTMVGVWDGALLCLAWCPTSSKVVRFATWDGVAASATRADPPALPAGYGNVNGLSMAHDPTTDDIFLFTHDLTDGDIYWTRWTRSGSTWSAWAMAVGRTAYNLDNKVQALRHVRFGNVDIVLGNYTANNSGTLFHARVLSLTRTPSAPTLESPANGAGEDLNTGATFTWKYNAASPGDTQQAYAFRRTYSTTTEYWNAGSQAWQTTEFFNNGASTSVSFPAGRWANGTTYAWSVRTRSSTGADSAYAPNRTVVSTAAPVVVVTQPEGIIYGESTPLIAWTYTSADAQRDYEIRIVQSASGIDPLNPGPSVWTSGVTTSSVARERRTDVALNPDVSYRAYVRATSTTSVSSAWTYSEFSLSATPPTGPLVGVLDELAYPSDIPRARLDVQARTNFLSEDQALGQAGWENFSNATVTAQPQDLAALLEPSLKMTAVASGPVSARTVAGSPPSVPADLPQPLGPLDFPVISGEDYTALGFFRSDTAARAGRVAIQWWDSDEGTGSLLSTSTGEQVNLTTSSYTLASATFTAPPNAKLARIIVEGLGAAAANEIFYVARISFHPGSTTTWTPGGFAERQTVRVERSSDDGATWVQILDRIRTDYWQRAIILDRTMPLNKGVMYRAYTDVDLDNGNFLTSDLSPVSVMDIPSDNWIIRDPLDEEAEEFVYVVGHDHSDTEALTVHRPAGRIYPVVDSEGFQSGEGSLSIYVPADRIKAVTALLQRSATLLVQSPSGDVLLVRFSQRDYAVEALRHRIISAPYVEVES